jgi:hypothetical protein
MTRLIVICISFLLFLGCSNNVSDTSNNLKSLAEKVIAYESDAAFIAHEAVEVLRITGKDVSPLFGRLNQVRVLSDGSILAFDAASVVIHHFDVKGNLLSTFGSSGNGPGEFSNEAVIQTNRDNLYVFDRLAYKIEKFVFLNSQWVHSGTIPLENIDGDIPWSLLKTDDDFAWMQFRHTGKNNRGIQISVFHVTTLLLNDPTSSNTWLATLPEINLIFEDLGGFIASYPAPYTPGPIVGITSMNDIILARTDEFSFLRIPGNEQSSVILTSLPVDNIKLTAEEKGNFSGYAERIHTLVKQHMPEFRPAVLQRIVTDQNNGFWAGYQIKEKNENRWLYFNEKGNIEREILLPVTFTPQAYSEGVLYGLKPDKDGIRIIAAYQINSAN